MLELKNPNFEPLKKHMNLEKNIWENSEWYLPRVNAFRIHLGGHKSCYMDWCFASFHYGVWCSWIVYKKHNRYRRNRQCHGCGRRGRQTQLFQVCSQCVPDVHQMFTTTLYTNSVIQISIHFKPPLILICVYLASQHYREMIGDFHLLTCAVYILLRWRIYQYSLSHSHDSNQMMSPQHYDVRNRIVDVILLAQLCWPHMSFRFEDSLWRIGCNCRRLGVFFLFQSYQWLGFVSINTLIWKYDHIITGMKNRTKLYQYYWLHDFPHSFVPTANCSNREPWPIS